MSDPENLKPLAMGELVDQTARLWRKNFKSLFQLYLVIELVAYIVLKAFTLASQRWFPLLAGGPALRLAARDPDSAGELVRQVTFGGAALAIAFLLSFFLQWLGSVAASRWCIERMLGQPEPIWDSARRSASRFGRATGAFVLATLWGFGVAALAALPGLALIVYGAIRNSTPAAAGGALLVGLGLLAAALWYVLRFLLTTQVIAMEEVGAVGSLRRSGALISGRIGAGLLNLVKVRATILLTVVFLIQMTVTFVADIPAVVVQLIYGHLFDPDKQDPSAIPQVLLVPAELFTVVAQAAVVPLYLVFAAIFYLDMRVRREGLDLQVKLGTAKAA